MLVGMMEIMLKGGPLSGMTRVIPDNWVEHRGEFIALAVTRGARWDLYPMGYEPTLVYRYRRVQITPPGIEPIEYEWQFDENVAE